MAVPERNHNRFYHLHHHHQHQVFSVLIVLFLILVDNALCIRFPDRVAPPALHQSDQQRLQVAVFALGSFWRSEAVFGCLPGVVHTTVGYAGGSKSNPEYRSLGDHAECVKVPSFSNFPLNCLLFLLKYKMNLLSLIGWNCDVRIRDKFIGSFFNQLFIGMNLILITRAWKGWVTVVSVWNEYVNRPCWNYSDDIRVQFISPGKVSLYWCFGLGLLHFIKWLGNEICPTSN